VTYSAKLIIIITPIIIVVPTILRILVGVIIIIRSHFGSV
jgi:hypothetical protein